MRTKHGKKMIDPFSYASRCENPKKQKKNTKGLANHIPQCIKKIIHHYKVSLMPGMKRHFDIRNYINIIHHITRLKEKKHMIDMYD